MILSFDVGGTFIKWGLVDNYQIIEKAVRHHNKYEVIDELKKEILLEELIKKVKN